MRRRLLERTISTLVATLLLLSSGFAQAAPVPVHPADAGPRVRLEKELVPPSDANPPAKLVDRGIEAMGGMAAAQQRRLEVLQANQQPQAAPIAAAAAPAANPKPEEPLRHLYRAPKPTPSPRATAAAPAGMASPRRNITLEPEQQVQMAGAYAGYALQLTQDIFPINTQVNTTATLTKDGVPVAGATIQPSVGSSTVATDATGTAQISFTAPEWNYWVYLRVTTQDGTLQSYALNQIMIVEPGYGGVIVESVTAPNGDPISTFHTEISYANGSFDNRYTTTGTAGFILRASSGWVTVRAELPGASYLHHQAVTITDGGRTIVHPSGAGMALVRLDPKLDGNAMPAPRIMVHTAGMSYTTMHPFFLSKDLYLTSGSYNVVVGSEYETEHVLITGSFQADGLTPMDLPLYESRVNLGTALFSMTPEPLGSVTMQTMNIGFPIYSPSKPVRLAGSYHPALYSSYITGPPDYNYSFYNQIRSPQTIGPNQTVTFELGTPLMAELSLAGSLMPGSRFYMNTGVVNPWGDRLRVLTCENHMCTTPTGTMRLYDDNLNLLQAKTVSIDSYQVALDLPAGISGSITVTVEYDPGPIHAPVTASKTYQVAGEGAYELTLSKDVFQPGESATVTGRLTLDGQPAVGASLQVGNGGEYGFYTTDANGEITFPFTAGSQAKAVAIYLSHNGAWGRPGYLFVLTPNDTAVVVKGATDAQGQKVNSAQVTLSSFTEDGGWSINGDWLDRYTVAAAILPVGKTYVELSAEHTANNHSLFLYQSVPATAGGKQEVTLSGAGAVPLTISPSLDDAFLAGGIILHDNRMTGQSQFNDPLPQPVDVLPGDYSFVHVGKSTNTLLSGNVSVSGPTDLLLSVQTADLAQLMTPFSDGQGNPVSSNWIDFLAGQIAVELEANRTYLVTAGHPYKLSFYDLPAGDWSYQFYRYQPEPLTPAAGSTHDLKLGGPLEAYVWIHDLSGSAAPGSTYTVEGYLRTAAMKDSFRAYGNGSTGTARLLDDTGNPVSSWPLAFISWWSFNMQVPETPGNYTLVLDLNAGPYQPAVHKELTVTVAAQQAPMELTVTPNLIPVGVTTDVTVRVTRDGAPVAGQRVDIEYGRFTGTTDANGDAVIPVQLSSSTASEVRTYDSQTNGYSLANLFVVRPGEAAVEVTATLADGTPMTGFFASAEASGWVWSHYDRNGKVGLIAPAGSTFVGMIREGSPAYFMHRTVNLAAGVVNPVFFDGQTAAIQQFTADLDGSALDTGWLALAPVEKRWTTWLWGLSLGNSGSGTAYITPGTYSALLKGRYGNKQVAVTRHGHSLQGGPALVSVSATELGQVAFTAEVAGEAVPISTMELYTSRFEIYLDQLGLLWATADSYDPNFIAHRRVQSSGTTWEYGLWGKDVANVVVTAGESQSLHYDLSPANLNVWTNQDSYVADSYIEYEFRAGTPSGFVYDTIRNTANWSRVAPLQATITDAAGQTVSSMTSSCGTCRYSFRVPNTPSDSYTITASRDLGVLGIISAAKTVRLEEGWVIRVKGEVAVVGRQSPVTVTISQRGKPVAGAHLNLSGYGLNTWAQTNAKGQVTIPFLPKEIGTYRLSFYRPEGQWVEDRSIYAVAPGWGLVDVKATDSAGAPLVNTDFLLFDAGTGELRGGGGSNPTHHTKAIVPAGLHRAAVRGNALNGDPYYMVGEVNVPSLSEVTLQASGAGTVSIAFSLTGIAPEAVSYANIVLRNTALDYTEQYSLDLPLHATLHLTPGTYEPLVMLRSPGIRYLLPLPELVTASQSELVADASLATGTLQAVVTAPAGYIPAPGISLQTLIGRVGYGFYLSNELVRTTPGVVRVQRAAYDLTSSTGSELWNYTFWGDLPVTVPVGGTAVLDLGGAVTQSLRTPSNAAAPGTPVVFTGKATTGAGLELEAVWLRQNNQWKFLNPTLEIIGPNGYSALLLNGAPRFYWETPPQTGTYTAKLLWDVGPLGGNAEPPTTKLNVLRLPIRRP